LIFVSAAFMYVRYYTPIYKVKSSLLLEGTSDLSNSILSEVPGIDNKTTASEIYNQIFILKSKDLIKKATDSLNLNVHYYIKGRVKEREMYEESPIQVLLHDSLGFNAPSNVELSITQSKDGEFVVQEDRKSV